MSKNLPKVILICIAAILFTGILYFGLRPKGFESSNQVNWLENKNGIRVGRYNTCYADNLLQESNGNLKIPREFTIQIALKSQSTSKDGFQCIMVFHDGSDAEQLLVGQWQSSIVIMNGDDYDNKKRTPKMYIKEGIPSGTKRFLTITTGRKGTFVYLQGELTRASRDLFLKIPAGNSERRLSLGNSVNCKQPWRGEFYGLVVFPYELKAKEISTHFEIWKERRSFTYAKNDSPVILYTFEEKSGQKAIDHSGHEHHLSLPAKIHILRKEILVAPQWDKLRTASSVQDVVLNFLGFIPFALALNAVFLNVTRWSVKNSFFLTLLVCFSISLAIELIQAEIPSRSSQLIDLILNTLGSGLGLVVFGHWYSKIMTNNERHRRVI